MEEISFPGRDDPMRQQFIAQHGGPAFLRRAQRVQEALDLLLAQCRKQRDEWLRMVRLHLGTLRALAGDWESLRPFLADSEQIETLERLYAELKPQLRLPVEQIESPRKLRAALGELIDSIKAFNCRWQAFLDQVDLRPVNEQRENYNRHYLLEKECLVRSVRVARQGYQRMEAMTLEELAAQLPPLPVPMVEKC